MNAQQQNELIRQVNELFAEWDRQKKLFPVIKQDGWMDARIKNLKALLAEPTKQEYVSNCCGATLGIYHHENGERCPACKEPCEMVLTE